ncbi:MAG: UTP--glucose-1-phosphate uridylyltransferase GalU [Pseudomonadota bacterium]|nr:UTP--glucose-1-phosphate uridylyltransferase GalU [Pseudomonadota bacterium]
MNNAIRKAVFPVAGLGTRFLPATKANPKEMLPVVDKPLIQYAAEEAVAAGIDVLIFVTGRSKRSIPDHFDKAYELEVELKTHNKRKMLSLVREILPANVSCVYIRQAEALGLGHAVLCARPVVGNEPFAVILADDLIYNDVDGCLSQMVDIYKEHGCGLIGVQAVPKDEVHSYGIVEGEAVGDRLWKINSMVEKPQPSETSSNIAVVGRYILTPFIFDLLPHVKKGAGGEIQLTDAIARQLEHEEVLAYEFLGKRYDCGNKLGYLEATVEYALKHPELHARFREYLKNLDYKSTAR